MSDNRTPICEVCEGELGEVPKSMPCNNHLNVLTGTRESKRIVSLSCGHAGHKTCMNIFFSVPDRCGTRECPTPNCNERHSVEPVLQNLQLNFKPSKTLNDTKELKKKLAEAEYRKTTAETCRADSESRYFRLMEEKQTNDTKNELENAGLRKQLEQLQNKHPCPLLIDLTNSPSSR